MGLNEFVSSIVQGLAIGLGIGTGTAVGSYLATKHFLGAIEAGLKKLREA